MASYAKGIDLYTIDELGWQVQREVARSSRSTPGTRVRLKAIGGGGGKGPAHPRGPLRPTPDAKLIEEAAAEAPTLVREVLNEVKATGVGDNKNVLIELNIEQTRHNEIQLLGNGRWCVSLGGRDCSLQMHEQKLLEISVTQEAHRRDREGGPGGQEGRASIARDRPRDPEADGGRRGALRRSGRARLRLDLRVHRRPASATTSWR